MPDNQAGKFCFPILDGQCLYHRDEPTPETKPLSQLLPGAVHFKDRPDTCPVTKHMISYLVPGVERIPPRLENGDGHSSADHA